MLGAYLRIQFGLEFVMWVTLERGGFATQTGEGRNCEGISEGIGIAEISRERYVRFGPRRPGLAESLWKSGVGRA